MYSTMAIPFTARASRICIDDAAWRSVPARSAGVIAVLLFAATPAATAAELRVVVKTHGGEAVEHAVVTARALGTPPVLATGEVIIDQKGKEFIPRVSVVPVGTRVRFPNSDDIRHHVYSSSPAKTFEIPLYKGTPANPIVFDRPGVVTLGCNIHDWMMAYVFVSTTPYFAITQGDGSARLTALPSGRYAVEVWHPQLKGAPEPAQHELTVRLADGTDLAFVVALKPAWNTRRAAGVLSGGYR